MYVLSTFGNIERLNIRKIYKVGVCNDNWMTQPNPINHHE